MEINVKQSSHIIILELVGELDMYNAHNIKEVINSFISEGKNKFLLDLNALTYIDSGGIGALISIYSTIKKNNLKLQIANVTGTVRQVIEITKLLNYFPISDTLEESLEKLE